MSDVFPLPLVPFEEYLAIDDRPRYRMTFLFEMTFDGRIDRSAFNAGVAEASDRHPLLKAFIEKRRFRSWRWVSAGDTQPQVDWLSFNEPVVFPDDPGIDLTQEVGVRFFVRVGNCHSRLVALFHHACCDGMGAIQYLSDLFCAYTRFLFPSAEKHPAYQPALASHLMRRGDLDVHRDETMSWFRLFRRTMAYCWKFSTHPPLPLARPRTAGAVETPLPYPGTLTRTLSPAVQRAIKQVARRCDVTVNELLIRELMLTIRQWNQRYTSVKDTDQISVLIPTNLRNLEHDQMPAANVMSLIAFQCSVGEMNSPEKLLEWVKKESRFFKRWRYAAVTLNALKALRWIPGSLRLILSRQKAASSAVLSCIGDPSLAIAGNFPVNEEGNPILGNLVFTDLNAAPPIRPHTHAAFTTWHYSNKLRLGVRCDSAIFTQETAQELLDLYADRVVELAASAVDRREAARVAA